MDAAAMTVAIAIDRILDFPLDMALTPFEPGRGPQTIGYALAVRTSTIAKQQSAGAGTTFAFALGKEIRRRREAIGLSQTSAAAPMSRAFLSLVERGQVVPSLPSLLIVARQLDTSAADILRCVEYELEDP